MLVMCLEVIYSHLVTIYLSVISSLIQKSFMAETYVPHYWHFVAGIYRVIWNTGNLLTRRTDGLPQDLVKSSSRDILV